MPRLSTVLFAFATATGLVLAAQPAVAVPALPALPALPARADGGLPARARAQMEALAAAKLARTPVQRKIESTLLTAAQLANGRPLPAGVHVSPGVRADEAGLTTVDVRGRVDAGLVARVHLLGGRVRSTSPRHGVARVDIPLTAVEALAGSPAVTRVAAAAMPITGRVGRPVPALGKEERDRRLRQRVKAALAAARTRGRSERAGPAARALAGTVTSEGDRVHAADTARARYRASGIGVTVGVLSDGVDSLEVSVASGDLPPVQVLPEQAGSGDEGTAMLEIVHNLAPKATLAFATAFNGPESFADNIRALRAAGADVIVDDVLYFGESPFQDGPIAQAVIDVTGDGAIYVSSAGNAGNVADGTAGNYEGDFVSSGAGIGKFVGVAHDFRPGPGVQQVDPLTPGSAGAPAILQWADPLGASVDDYDLYALDSTGNVVAFGNDVQDGDDDPFEGFYVPDTGGATRLAVVKFAGADRYFQLTAFRGRFAADGDLTGYATRGVTRGHSTVPAAVSVAAAPAHEPLPFELEPGDPPNPSGPFPGVFTKAQRSEPYTSDGPRRVFFHPDGTPITPGNFTVTGGRVRQKPQVTAADGVRTSVEDFETFYGTSAAAPHAAAIAALVLASNPGIAAADVRAGLGGTAIDIEAPGPDPATGRGILRADRALAATGATAQPYVVSSTPVLAGTTDGDAFLEPGETAVVNVAVTNHGDAPAQQVSVRLSTPTGGVSIRPAVRSFGRVLVNQTKTAAPFAVTVADRVPVGTLFTLTATVSFVGGYSPQRTTAQLVVGQPADEGVDATFSGPPLPIPDSDSTGVRVPLEVTGVGPVSRVTFSVDGTTCTTDEATATVGIDHTYVGDLVGTLTAPDGTAVILFTRTGGNGNNICQAVFDDTATRSIQTATSADAPFTGSWQPAQPLGRFLATDGDGTWSFSLVDAAVLDTGSVRAVSLHVTGFVGG